jgi:hypothetical protein
MKRICAWCGKVLGEIEGTGGLDSHGICPDCQEKFRQRAEGQKEYWGKNEKRDEGEKERKFPVK